MKWLFLFLILLPSLASAASISLVCDPYAPEVQVQGFRGTINGIAFDTPYSVNAYNEAVIYDCTGLGDEAWIFANVRAYNARGESAGVPFVWPALPESPSQKNIHLR